MVSGPESPSLWLDADPGDGASSRLLGGATSEAGGWVSALVVGVDAGGGTVRVQIPWDATPGDGWEQTCPASGIFGVGAVVRCAVDGAGRLTGVMEPLDLAEGAAQAIGASARRLLAARQELDRAQQSIDQSQKDLAGKIEDFQDRVARIKEEAARAAAEAGTAAGKEAAGAAADEAAKRAVDGARKEIASDAASDALDQISPTLASWQSTVNAAKSTAEDAKREAGEAKTAPIPTHRIVKGDTLLDGDLLADGTVGAREIVASEALWAKIGHFAKITTPMLEAGNATIPGKLIAGQITGISIESGEFNLPAAAVNGKNITRNTPPWVIHRDGKEFGSRNVSHSGALAVEIVANAGLGLPASGGDVRLRTTTTNPFGVGNVLEPGVYALYFTHPEGIALKECILHTDQGAINSGGAYAFRDNYSVIKAPGVKKAAVFRVTTRCTVTASNEGWAVQILARNVKSGATIYYCGAERNLNSEANLGINIGVARNERPAITMYDPEGNTAILDNKGVTAQYKSIWPDGRYASRTWGDLVSTPSMTAQVTSTSMYSRGEWQRVRLGDITSPNNTNAFTLSNNALKLTSGRGGLFYFSVVLFFEAPSTDMQAGVSVELIQGGKTYTVAYAMTPTWGAMASVPCASGVGWVNVGDEIQMRAYGWKKDGSAVKLGRGKLRAVKIG